MGVSLDGNMETRKRWRIVFTSAGRLSLFFDNRWHFRQAFHFESLGCLEESWQLILCHIDLTSIHKFQNGLKMSKRDIFQNDDGVL